MQEVLLLILYLLSRTNESAYRLCNSKYWLVVPSIACILVYSVWNWENNVLWNIPIIPIVNWLSLRNFYFLTWCSITRFGAWFNLFIINCLLADFDFWRLLFWDKAPKVNWFFVHRIDNRIYFKYWIAISIITCGASHCLVSNLVYKFIKATLNFYLLNLVVIIIPYLLLRSSDDWHFFIFVYLLFNYLLIVLSNVRNTFAALSNKPFQCQIIGCCKAIMTIHLNFLPCIGVLLINLVLLDNLLDNLLIVGYWLLANKYSSIVLYCFYLLKPSMRFDIC